jgi:hypothetical protein
MKRSSIEDVYNQVLCGITFYETRISNAERTYLNWAHSWFWTKESLSNNHVGRLKNESDRFREVHKLALNLNHARSMKSLDALGVGSPTELK